MTRATTRAAGLLHQLPHGGAGGGQVREAEAGDLSAFRTILLPLPPSANRIWRRAGRRVHLSGSYAAWKRVAGLMIAAAGIAPVAGPYALRLDLPERMRGDIDNRVKPVNDMLVLNGLVADDRLCRRIVIARDHSLPAASCRIGFAPIANPNEEH